MAAMWALINDRNEITNLIVYDGVSDYAPPAGMRLALVPEDAKLGDLAEPA
jgi:hypothetical protein